MGYTITIGELEVEKNPEDGLDSDCISFGAKGQNLDDAPAFGEPTDYTNSRWPSYTSWSGALEDAGMYDLFFCEGHLIGGHPGIRLITKELVEAVAERKAEFERRHPNVKATYGNVSGPFESDADNPGENGVYCRIVWLDYWLKWAYENCETPVIANS